MYWSRDQELDPAILKLQGSIFNLQSCLKKYKSIVNLFANPKAKSKQKLGLDGFIFTLNNK